MKKTKYEKFLKGNILPYKEQVLEYDPCTKTINVYVCRISTYREKFYILITKHKTILQSTLLTDKEKLYIRGTYVYTFGRPRWKLPRMASYFILEKRTLKSLGRFLKCPDYFIYQNRTGEKI